MEDPTPLSVFFDNCVLSIGDTLQGATRTQGINWGNRVYQIAVAGYKRKPLPSSNNESWKRSQVECLPTIARLLREGVICALTYAELHAEGMKRPGSFPRAVAADVFADASFKHVDAAVERSYFFQMEFSQYIKSEELIRFCKWLLTPGIEQLGERLSTNPRYPTELLKNLKNVQRFRDLCQGLSENHYPDALHLWTAEVNDADYFLTIDRKFINVMTQTKRMVLSCEPIAPSDLLTKLGVHDRDPFRHEEGHFYDLSGRPS